MTFKTTQNKPDEKQQWANINLWSKLFVMM